MGNTIGYLRVSSHGQSVKSQRYEMDKRHKIDRYFIDENVSGAVNAVNRDGFSQMLNYLREGDTVIVPAVDRLGRDSLDLLATLDKLQSMGVAVVSMREGFDLSTPVGKMMYTVISAVADMERTNIKERQRKGIEAAQASGVRFGRKRDTERESEIIKLLREGIGATEIARRLGCGRATIYRVKERYPAID